MKKKKLLIIVAVILVLMVLLVQCSSDSSDSAADSAEKPITTDVGDQEEAKAIETEEIDNNEKKDETSEKEGMDDVTDIIEDNIDISSSEKHYVGDAIELHEENGAAIRLCVTEWKSCYIEGTLDKILYVSYQVENIGDISTTVGNGMFNVYADEYVVDQYYMEGTIAPVEISPGRKFSGQLYAKVDPDKVFSSLELEVGDAVIVLKEPPEVDLDMYKDYETEEDGKYVLDDMVGTYVDIGGLGITVIIERVTDYSAKVTFKGSEDSEPDYVFEECMIAEGVAELYALDETQYV